MMYEFRIFNYAKDTIASSEVTQPIGICSENKCTNCPANRFCLLDCDWDQWDNLTDCGECESECDSGCLREENCNLCHEVACEECAGYSGECITCVENATTDSDGHC